MIQRMLQAGLLTQAEIAREAGVSDTIVGEVARGRRPPVTRLRPPLRAGERFRASQVQFRTGPVA